MTETIEPPVALHADIQESPQEQVTWPQPFDTVLGSIKGESRSDRLKKVRRFVRWQLERRGPVNDATVRAVFLRLQRTPWQSEDELKAWLADFNGWWPREIRRVRLMARDGRGRDW